MQSNWAAENLQTIRTLMERAVVYRRTLAPVTLVTGLLGCGAAAGGWYGGIKAPLPFACYWLAMGGLILVVAGLIMRRQAFQEAEPFWSPPTRRVGQALLPGLVAGLGLSVLAVVAPSTRLEIWLPCAWLLFYGCALHAAGFFMPRGVKWLGWLFIVAGITGLCLQERLLTVPGMGHLLMGACFGGGHVLYGIYLYGTESRRGTQ